MDELITKLVSSEAVPTGFRPGALRIRYQDYGLRLIRCDFRVDKAVWFRLGQMARTLGISRCLLFATLLQALATSGAEFRRMSRMGRWLLMEVLDATRYARLAEWIGRPRSTTSDRRWSDYALPDP